MQHFLESSKTTEGREQYVYKKKKNYTVEDTETFCLDGVPIEKQNDVMSSASRSSLPFRWNHFSFAYCRVTPFSAGMRSDSSRCRAQM